MADDVNPAAVEAMREVGIDITGRTPTELTWDAAQESDVIVTMGCGDACPIFPGKRYEDWKLEDPAGRGVDAVRPIRDEIKTRVEALLAHQLVYEAGGSASTGGRPPPRPSTAPPPPTRWAWSAAG